MKKHAEWCSGRNPEYTGECDCDDESLYEDDLEEDRKEAKKRLIKQAHKQFKRENKR